MTTIQPLWAKDHSNVQDAQFLHPIGDHRFGVKSFSISKAGGYDLEEYDINKSIPYQSGIFLKDKTAIISDEQFGNTESVKLTFDHYPMGKGIWKQIGGSHQHITYIVSNNPKISPGESLIEDSRGNGKIIFLAYPPKEVYTRQMDDGSQVTLIIINPWGNASVIEEFISNESFAIDLQQRYKKEHKLRRDAEKDSFFNKLQAETSLKLCMAYESDLRLTFEAQKNLLILLERSKIENHHEAMAKVDDIIRTNQLSALHPGNAIIESDRQELFTTTKSMIQSLETMMALDGGADISFTRSIFSKVVNHIGGVDVARRLLSEMVTQIGESGTTHAQYKEPTPQQFIEEQIRVAAQSNLPSNEAVRQIHNAHANLNQTGTGTPQSTTEQINKILTQSNGGNQ